MANSAHFAGTDLSGTTYGLTVVGGSVSLGAPPRVQYQPVPFRNGGYDAGGFLEARTISFRAYVAGTSESDLASKIDALNRLLNTTSAQSLRFDNFLSGRYWLVRLSSPIDSDFTGSSHEFDLEFTAADPVAYSTTETTQTVSVSGSPTSATVPASGTIGGSEYAEPVWLYTAGGTETSILLQNTTTEETIKWNGSLSNTHKLRIDAARFTIEKSTDGGTTWTNYMSGRAANPDSSVPIFPRLRHGVANAITLTGPTTGSLVVTYRERYR